MRLTAVAHAALATAVRPGDVVLDATAGNGHDTLALAELVGPTGRVFAFDIQQIAIDHTVAKLAAAGVTNVVLMRRDHAELREAIPPEYHGRFTAAVFNLGYLPGGDKQIVTQIESSRTAILTAAELLRAGGLLTVTAYPGHSGGADEAGMVAEVFARYKGSGWAVTETASMPGSRIGPHLWVGTKTR